MTQAGQDSNACRGCIYSHQQAWAPSALPVRLKLSAHFNVDVFMSLNLPHSLGAPVEVNPCSQHPSALQNFLSEQKNSLLPKSWCFHDGNEIPWRATGGNESVPRDWRLSMQSFPSAVMQVMATQCHPQQVSTGDNSWLCRCSIHSRTSLCRISSPFACPSHGKMLQEARFPRRNAVIPCPAVPADWLLSAPHLWHFPQSASSSWYCFEIPQEREIHIWLHFWLAHFLPFSVPFGTATAGSRPSRGFAALGVSPHYVIGDSAVIFWANSLFAAPNHLFCSTFDFTKNE